LGQALWRLDAAAGGNAVFHVARGVMTAGGSWRTSRAGALGARARMSRTVGMEFEEVIGHKFWVEGQELSSACAGCLMGISA
jgi:hypothetical protein